MRPAARTYNQPPAEAGAFAAEPLIFKVYAEVAMWGRLSTWIASG
jgi:hypothetical protein